jgi:hypothetical protein
MKCILPTLALLLACPVAVAAQQAEPIPAEVQIALAIQAAPPDHRDDATVQGYDASGNFVVLREGTGDMICMAPNPAAERFEVSCHAASLEPFFARGRELSAQGIEGQERISTRWKEFEAGTLPIPYGTVNYIMTGSGFDPATHEIQDPFTRWVIYTPNATPESTGLSIQATSGAPWLMFPGTAGAHIMIVPPRGG